MTKTESLHLGHQGHLAFLLRECLTWREMLSSECPLCQAAGARLSSLDGLVRTAPKASSSEWVSSPATWYSGQMQLRGEASGVRTLWLGKCSLWVLSRDPESANTVEDGHSVSQWGLSGDNVLQRTNHVLSSSMAYSASNSPKWAGT